MTHFLAILLSLLLGPAASPMPPADGDHGERGPRTVVLDQIAACYGSVVFDHGLHVDMSSIDGGCTNCHHHEPVDGVIQPCRACHALETSVVRSERLGLRGAYHRQCLSCHKEWAHENACGVCHVDAIAVAAGGQAPKVALPGHVKAEPTYRYQTNHPALPIVTFHHADHAERFGLKCADCHGGSSCGQCHGPRIDRPLVTRESSCFGCHAERRCVTCHNVAEKERFDHARCAGWRLRPGHTDLACSSCHGETRMPGRPLSDACRSCHAEQSGGVFEHGAATGVFLSGNHALFECVTCHAGGDDRAIARCSSCHAARPIAGRREVGRAGVVAGAASEPWPSDDVQLSAVPRIIAVLGQH